MKRFAIAVLLIAALAAGGIAYQSFTSGAAEPTAPAASRAPRQVTVPVVAASVVRKPSPVRIETIGSVQPIATVTIKPRIAGLIAKPNFTDGQDSTAAALPS